MKTFIQVISRKGRSLRDRIATDQRLERYGLQVTEHHQKNRNPGWTKIKGTGGQQGAINIDWDAKTQTLLCHVVNRNGGKPDALVGDFVEYLLASQRRVIHSISIVGQ